MIDRITPTRRPDLPVRGLQQWRSLLFLHWEVPAEILRPLLPKSMTLDLYERKAYVGLVPFAMQGIRPRWWPRGLGLNFLETNVRTYVVCGGRPGVYFFSLDANSRLAVQTARWMWSLPYYFATMQMQRDGNRVRYQSQRRGGDAHVCVHYSIGDTLGASRPGTIEHFLLERYLLFVTRRERVYVGQVHHAPYQAQSAAVEQLDESLILAAGLPQPDQPPPLVHYCQGVDVEVFPLLPVAQPQPDPLSLLGQSVAGLATEPDARNFTARQHASGC